MEYNYAKEWMKSKQEATWESLLKTDSQKGCYSNTGLQDLWVMKGKQLFVT